MSCSNSTTSKRGRALPLHVVGALAVLRAWHRTQAPELRARVEPWLNQLESMYRETPAERAAGALRAFARTRPTVARSTRKRR